jgi:hypothetical protein
VQHRRGNGWSVHKNYDDSMFKELMNKVLISTSALLFTATAWGSSIIIGVNNSLNLNPFGGATAGNAGTRYQQAYNATDFTGLGAISISSIDFLEGDGGTLAPSTYTLSFSTITAGINTLSDTDFNSNLGSDNTLFTSVSLSGAAPGTLAFNGTPYIYNPSDGNLLLDIIVSPGGNVFNGFGVAYAASDGTTDYSEYQNFTASGTIGYGLVTQFNFTAVPEPSTLALISLATALTRMIRRNGV